MQDYNYPPYQNSPSPRPQKKSNLLWWILGGFAALIFLFCGGIFASLLYVGTVGPETSVYTGNRVPDRFVSTMEDVGALDPDETILFFYSDALTDIRDGFYFVSDKRVVIYIQGTASPVTSISFDQITEAEIYRDESFFEDSQILLTTREGQFHAFPVSSEYDRDQKFFEAIESRAAIEP